MWKDLLMNCINKFNLILWYNYLELPRKVSDSEKKNRTDSFELLNLL